MTEQLEKEPTERVEMFVRGGREVRQYTNTETQAVRFEGFVVFMQEIKDGGVVMTKKHPADFDIDAVDYNEALDKFDQRADETLETIKAEAEDARGPRIQTAPAGVEKLIQIPGG